MWDVANTDNPNGVNCQTVNILISFFGDKNFDFILADSILNNGSYTFIVPPTIPTNSARIMVQANDNIFFDINNGIINIQNNKALIEGNTKFIGAELMSSDLRASVALVFSRNSGKWQKYCWKSLSLGKRI